MNGISVSNLTVTYRNGHRALEDASFTIPTGSIAALVGINGSGKSTMFKSIMGFVPSHRGKVEVLGLPVREAIARRLVAYVPQSEEVDWDFPVLVQDVVMMGRYGHMGFFRRPRQSDINMVEQSLERVDLLDLRHRQIGELSGGQKKRVFLARALAQESRVILLDEPFTGVDVTTEEQIINLLKTLRDEGSVILISTHNLGSVPAFCDQTILLNRRVLAAGETQKIFTKKNLRNAFGGTLRQFTLEGAELHDDEDPRQVTVLSDDERPFVIYGEDKDDLATQKNGKLAR